MISIKSKFLHFLKQHEEKIILALLIVLSIVSIFYFYNTKQILLYKDARAHLDIARRLSDSLTPGFMQIGSVWLPIYQLLVAPFAANDFLWHSGLAGSIVSGSAFVGASIYTYKIVRRVTRSFLISFVALLFFCTNPNLLYLQSVPLDEVLAMFFICAATYYVIRWVQSRSIPILLLASALLFAGALVRYELWLLVLAFIPYIFVSSLRDKNQSINLKRAEGNTMLFASLAFFAIAIWLLFNFIGWNNPLYFLNGDFSAKSQQANFAQKGLLLTKHNLGMSFSVFVSNIVDNLGIASTLLFGIFFVFALVKKGEAYIKGILLSSLAPLLFVLLTVYLGITIIYTSLHPLPGTTELFNTRYGILAIIPATLTFGVVFASIQKYFKPGAFLFLFFVIVNLYLSWAITPAVIRDGKYGLSAYGRNDEENISNAISSNCSNGLTLISAGQNDTQIFESNNAMKKFIYEGSGKYWEVAVKNPSKLAECIVVTNNDALDAKLARNGHEVEGYDIIYNSGNDTFVYKKTNELASVVQAEKGNSEEPICKYVVKRGDSLTKIARNIYGFEKDIDKLIKLNNEKKLLPIKVGQLIKVPCEYKS